MNSCSWVVPGVCGQARGKKKAPRGTSKASALAGGGGGELPPPAFGDNVDAEGLQRGSHITATAGGDCMRNEPRRVPLPNGRRSRRLGGRRRSSRCLRCVQYGVATYKLAPAQKGRQRQRSFSCRTFVPNLRGLEEQEKGPSAARAGALWAAAGLAPRRWKVGV